MFVRTPVGRIVLSAASIIAIGFLGTSFSIPSAAGAEPATELPQEVKNPRLFEEGLEREGRREAEEMEMEDRDVLETRSVPEVREEQEKTLFERSSKKIRERMGSSSVR